MLEALRFIDSNGAEFVIGLCVLSVVLFFYCIALSRKLSRVSKRRGQKPPGDTLGDIMDCLASHSQAVSDLQGRTDAIAAKLDEHGRKQLECLQRVGMVKFNAFDDVGGEQSFALVMLDANGDGVVVSSIYGRQDSRLYAKPISNTGGERPLSDEEQLALANALSGNKAAVGAESVPR